MPKARKDGGDSRPANSWHVIVEKAMEPIAAPAVGYVAQSYGSGGGLARRVRDKVDLPIMEVPDWARTAAPPEARPPRPLAPSAIADDKEAAPPPSETQRAAAERGTLIHHLLDRLAGVEPEQRHATALRWLERSAGVASRDRRQEIADTVCEVLSDSRFTALFGEGSLAEAPLAATLPDGRVVAGTVDRLLVEADRISVIDFKTGRVPETEGMIPASHRAQMSAYIEALRVIFPERDVRTALLYTGGPRLFEL
jgi:ATP-dependent helicase/nuclease subunit A